MDAPNTLTVPTELDPIEGKSRRMVFVLVPEFTLLSFASAVECLRIANRLASNTLYVTQVIHAWVIC